MTINSVVRLKSGGPEMVIAGFEKNGDARCGWFVGKKMNVKSFPVGTLVLVRQ